MGKTPFITRIADLHIMDIEKKKGENVMQMNRDMLAKLAGMSDAELWAQIRAMAGNYGYVLSSAQPSHAELEKMRSLMRGDVQISTMDAMRLLNQYKSKGQG